MLVRLKGKLKGAPVGLPIFSYGFNYEVYAGGLFDLDVGQGFHGSGRSGLAPGCGSRRVCCTGGLMPYRESREF